jgi:hypothetical protein
VQQQHREQRPLPAAADGDGPIVLDHFEWSKEPEIRHAVTTAGVEPTVPDAFTAVYRRCPAAFTRVPEGARRRPHRAVDTEGDAMYPHRLTRTAALGLTLAALAAPAAIADPIDRGDFAPDAARAGASAKQDMRMPDTRDYAAGRGTYNTPEVTVVRLTEPPGPAPSGGGIDWADAGIGAGVAFGTLLLCLGGTLAVVHRRHAVVARRRTATTV